MTSKRIVVPFERPAAYWRSRARRHDTPTRRPEAARMLRKALEKTGDPATALELARIYMDMACFSASERYLARAVARGGLTGEACFLLGCCALNRGESVLAEDAFDACQRISPDSEWADRAQDLLETMPWSREKEKRGRARSETLCRRAREALLAGRPFDARRFVEDAWKHGKSAQAALLMGTLSSPEKAPAYFRFAARETPDALQPDLLLAVTAGRAGKRAAALRALEKARTKCVTVSDYEEYFCAAWEVGAAALALADVTRQLEASPASVDYLRLKYLCLRRLHDEDGARRALETLLEIDPDDAAGLWYRRHPEDTRLCEGRKVLLSALGCQLRAVPERLRYGRLNRLLHGLVMALRDEVDAPAIYRLATPLWRRMPEAERRACDDGKPHLPFCLSLFILIAAGRGERAAELYRAAPNKRRVKRTLRRFAQWMSKE